MFPGGGIRSEVDVVISRAKWGKTNLTNLQAAPRAGAICAVVKVDPELEDILGVRNAGDPKAASETKGTPEPNEGAVKLAPLIFKERFLL